MEDQRLYNATIQGNVDSLLNLIQQDVLTLHRNNTTKYLENPLHIAVLLGHEQFAIVLLRLKPDLASELDVKGSSPLHLASARGNLEIVKACFRINPELCFACNRDGKNPIHVAAMRGRVDVLRELMRVKPDAGRAIVERESKTILHLCVEYGQLEALMFLVESGSVDDLVNYKETNGNTILHLAVSNKQVQITYFLLSVSTIDISALNNNGMTAMDILMQRGRDIRDTEIEGSFVRARASTSTEYNEAAIHSSILESKYNNPKDDWLERKRSTLMVVASLIATMAFQAGVNPPPENLFTPRRKDNNSKLDFFIYFTTAVPTFYVINTTSFFASLSVILLLMSGLPIKHRFFMWILTATTWIAITALALSYMYSVIIATHPEDQDEVVFALSVCMSVWIVLMTVLLTAHTLRMIYRTFKVLIIWAWKLVIVKENSHTNINHVRV